MLRRTIPFLVLLWLCSLCRTSDAASARHLFLDPAFSSQGENVALHVNPPERREVVIRPDKPWEKLMISFFLTVRDEGGKLRMWYICRDADNHPNVAYAESSDGVNWVKPDLGIVEYAGSKANNLVGLTSLEGVVYKDPRAKKPDEQYVYITHDRDEGIFRFCSPDGLRWRRDARPLLPFRADTQNVTFWDDAIGKYVMYLRGWDTSPGWNDRLRRVVRLTLDDLSKPAPVTPNGSAATPKRPKELPRIGTEIPSVFAADANDPHGTDVYNLSTQAYPLDPRWYVAFPSLMLRERNISDGRLEVQFAGSTDGVKWHRYDRAPYVRPGPAGSDSANIVFLGTGVVVRGDELWQYGTGLRSRHGDAGGRRRATDGTIYRYVQRVDGFVSLDFADAPGRCVTQAVKVDGPLLRLNLDTGGLGEMRVGLLDAQGKAIAGFAPEDSVALRTNSTGAAVRWRTNPNVSSLLGKDVRVELRGSRAKVFSFRFDPATGEAPTTRGSGAAKRLVLDDRVIASTDNARLVPGKVVKRPAPLFGEDKPWEPRFDNVYPNVIYDAEEKLYKCWYSPFTVDPATTNTPRGEGRRRVPYKAKVNEREMSVCYAVSKDGLRWEKPSLGLVEFQGSAANNIVLRNPHGAGVFKDARDPDPQRRYKMFYRPFEDPMAVAVRFSPDGLRWSDKTVCRDAQARADTHNNALWSAELGKYVGITRLIDKGDGQRLIGRTESTDFVNWSKAVEILRGDKENQTYAMTTFRSGDVYLGLVMVFRPKLNRVHCELAWSPDTLHWSRVAAGTPLIPLSEKEGDYDWGCAFASVPVVGPDGDIRLYYGASNGPHGGWRDGFLALASLRPDGWAGFAPVDAAKPASVTTKAIELRETSLLRLTTDAAGGSIRVVALDAANGRTVAVSRPITGNVTDERVEWEDASALERARGTPVQFRFELTEATLYAFSV